MAIAQCSLWIVVTEFNGEYMNKKMHWSRYCLRVTCFVHQTSYCRVVPSIISLVQRRAQCKDVNRTWLAPSSILLCFSRGYYANWCNSTWTALNEMCRIITGRFKKHDSRIIVNRIIPYTPSIPHIGQSVQAEWGKNRNVRGYSTCYTNVLRCRYTKKKVSKKKNKI